MADVASLRAPGLSRSHPITLSLRARMVVQVWACSNHITSHPSSRAHTHAAPPRQPSGHTPRNALP
jgi:hypothetical protein